MLSTFKNSLLLLWRGDKFWVITDIILTPVCLYIILDLYGANYILVFLAFSYALLITDFIFISFTQAIDVTEYLAFPASSKKKFTRLLMQNLAGFKIITFATCIIIFFIKVPHLMGVQVLLHMMILYLLTGLLFTNLMLKVKRSIFYAKLIKYVLPFGLLMLMQANHYFLTSDYFRKLDDFYISANTFITMMLLLILPLCCFFSFIWFKKIIKHEPFYDMSIVINHNKLIWLRDKYRKMHEVE